MVNNFLLDFKKTGYKLTAPRRDLLSTLSSSTPLSAQEVFAILKQKGCTVDLVTVYRTLELFHTLGIVNKIQFEDHTARYELVSDKDHHHHLVCIKCGAVEEVEANEAILLKQIRFKTDFKIMRHSLEFFGLCKRCQKT